MPKDYKKLYLEEQNSKYKLDLQINDLKNEVESLKRIKFTEQLNQPQAQQQVSQFEADVKYIISLCQRQSILLRECRNQMLPMSLGKQIDSLLRETDRL